MWGTVEDFGWILTHTEHLPLYFLPFWELSWWLHIAFPNDLVRENYLSKTQTESHVHWPDFTLPSISFFVLLLSVLTCGFDYSILDLQINQGSRKISVYFSYQWRWLGILLWHRKQNLSELKSQNPFRKEHFWRSLVGRWEFISSDLILKLWTHFTAGWE